MISVAHLHNVSKFLEKIQNPEVAKLQMHLIQCCRELVDESELPKPAFGPAALCPRCGSAWATTEHKTRILPRKFPPKRIENLIATFRRTGSRLSKSRHSLMLKCEKNKANKMIKICSVCSGSAKFSLCKPTRLKRPKPNPSNDSNLKLSAKKKKRRSRDKTAGLNLTVSDTPERARTTSLTQEKVTTPLLLTNSKKNLGKLKTPLSTSKPQKINLSKLKGIINTNVTPSRKSQLHAFLQEL